MTKDEALDLALEALVNHEGNYKLSDAGCDRSHKAITAIEQALEATVQEPVAWLSRRYVDNFPVSGYETAQPTDYGAFPVYTTTAAAQRQWVGLTTQDMATCIDEPAWDLVLRKAEQILKEKNT